MRIPVSYKQITVLAWCALSAALAASPSAAQSTGKNDYATNCAGCHGSNGKGAGPTLYVIPGIYPSDLTQLSKRAAGKFPFQHVEDSIDGRKGLPSHQRFDMPFWGVKFQESGKEFSPEAEARVKARIDDIVRYVDSLQEK